MHASKRENISRTEGILVTDEEYPKYVKEFGEGVNRMCNELEQVGLKNPIYYTNAFMLQVVIYNSNVKKVGYSGEKLTIECEKLAFEK